MCAGVEKQTNWLMWNITEQEAFITSALYKTQIYRINLSSMGRTNIMRGEMINVHKILVWISERKRSLRAWRRWNGNTENGVKEVWYMDVYCMQLNQHSDKYRVVSKKKLRLILSKGRQNFDILREFQTVKHFAKCFTNHFSITSARNYVCSIMMIDRSKHVGAFF
jgi:hypothetical protein